VSARSSVGSRRWKLRYGFAEVAAQSKNGKRLLNHLASANRDAIPELIRLALKLATGAGKTTVMAMIAWQTVNAVRHDKQTLYTRLSSLRTRLDDQRPAARPSSNRMTPTATTPAANSFPVTCSKT